MYQDREKLQKDILYCIDSGKLLFRGGTALRLVYGLNRYSEDIDFTNGNRQFADNIYYQCKIFSKSMKYNITALENQGQSGKVFYVVIPNTTPKIKVKVETSYESTATNFSYEEIEKVKVMSIEEILSEKIRAMIERSEPRDLFDMRYVYLHFNLSTDVDYLSLINLKMANSKYRTFNIKDFIRGVESRTKNWYDIEELIIDETLPDFDETKDYVIEQTKKLININ